jgi:hypothetical protein
MHQMAIYLQLSTEHGPNSTQHLIMVVEFMARCYQNTCKACV